MSGEKARARLVDLTGAAEFLGVEPAVVLAFISEGLLTCHRAAGVVYLRRAELEAFVSGEVPPPDTPLVSLPTISEETQQLLSIIAGSESRGVAYTDLQNAFGMAERTVRRYCNEAVKLGRVCRKQRGSRATLLFLTPLGESRVRGVRPGQASPGHLRSSSAQTAPLIPPAPPPPPPTSPSPAAVPRSTGHPTRPRYARQEFGFKSVDEASQPLLDTLSGSQTASDATVALTTPGPARTVGLDAHLFGLLEPSLRELKLPHNTFIQGRVAMLVANGAVLDDFTYAFEQFTVHGGKHFSYIVAIVNRRIVERRRETIAEERSWQVMEFEDGEE